MYKQSSFVIFDSVSFYILLPVDFLLGHTNFVGSCVPVMVTIARENYSY